MRGISSTWVSKLCRSGQIPCVAGRVDVRAADKALAKVTDAGEQVSFAEAARRWRLATAKLRELELEVKSGTLVDAEEVKRVLDIGFSNLKMRMLALPNKLAPIMAATSSPGECAELLKFEIYTCLDFLSRHIVDNPFVIPEEAFSGPVVPPEEIN